MRAVMLIARRDLASYLRTYSGYVILAGVLALNGLAFNAYVISGTSRLSADVLSSFFWWSSGFTMTAAVLIAMRLLAEERQTGTLALLYSSPVTDREIVLGKYLSGMGFLAMFILLTLYMPALILVNGKISVAQIAVGYLGLFLVGSATLAIGLFASSLVRSQLVAAVLGGVMVVTLIIFWWVARITERPLSEVFSALALHGQHFQPFQKGVIQLRDVAYYVLVTFVGLFASTRVLEARRWR